MACKGEREIQAAIPADRQKRTADGPCQAWAAPVVGRAESRCLLVDNCLLSGRTDGRTDREEGTEEAPCLQLTSFTGRRKDLAQSLDAVAAPDGDRDPRRTRHDDGAKDGSPPSDHREANA